jgi:hypothetical protein
MYCHWFAPLRVMPSVGDGEASNFALAAPKMAPQPPSWDGM